MSNVENLEDHMAFSCKCGCVRFNLLKSGGIECDDCGEKVDSTWGTAQPEQKPVAWRFRSGTWFNREAHWRYINTLEGTEGLLGLEPLYTHPHNQKKDEALRLALECLYGVLRGDYNGNAEEAITLIKQALENK